MTKSPKASFAENAPHEAPIDARAARCRVAVEEGGGPRYLAGRSSVKRGPRKPAIVIWHALRSLAKLFGRDEREIESLVEAWHVRDWQADPFARGGYAVFPVGGLEAQRELAKLRRHSSRRAASGRPLQADQGGSITRTCECSLKLPALSSRLVEFRVQAVRGFERTVRNA